jgi:hypothetical protein
MPQQQSNRANKGNPAHKRMSNLRLKAKRAECWNRGEDRKRKNRADNKEQHEKNVAFGMTHWQAVKELRQINRSNKVEQSRNKADHILLDTGDHEYIVCDHKNHAFMGPCFYDR